MCELYVGLGDVLNKCYESHQSLPFGTCSEKALQFLNQNVRNFCYYNFTFKKSLNHDNFLHAVISVVSVHVNKLMEIVHIT